MGRVGAGPPEPASLIFDRPAAPGRAIFVCACAEMPLGLRRGAPVRRKHLRATCFGVREPRDPAAGRGQLAFCAEWVLAGRKSTWPAERFGASAVGDVARRRFRRGGCLPGRALWAFGPRPRRCAAHFPPSGHVILAPVAGLAGPRAAKPSCRTPGAPLPSKLRGPNRQTAPRARLGVARRRKVRGGLRLDQPESAPSDLRCVHIRDERRRVEPTNVLFESQRLARVEHRHD